MSIVNVLKKSIFHSIRSVKLKIMSQIQPNRRVIILSKTNSENIFKPILPQISIVCVVLLSF